MRMRMLTVLFCLAAISPAFALDDARTERPAPPDAGQRRGGLTLPDGVTPERDLEYVAGGGKSQSLDLYLPARNQTALPLIVWIHGGGFSAGDKSPCPAVAMANHGYIVASLNYRFSQQAIFPAQIQDCQAAIRWLRANSKKYGIDPDHVGVWGASAGGHLVALVGTAGGKKAFPSVGGNEDQSDRVQAVCDWFGPTDFTLMDEQALPGGMKHNPADSPESRLIGGPVQENKEKAQAANPIHYVAKDAPPFLIMHGTNDPAVPPGQSDLLVDVLKRAGVSVLLQKLPRTGHGGPAFNSPAAQNLVQAFFDKNLKGLDAKVEPLTEADLAVVAGERDNPGDRPAQRDAGDRANPRRGDAEAQRAARDTNAPVGRAFERVSGLTDEQKAKIIEIRRKYEELIREQQKELMAVLTEEQRREFFDNAGGGRERAQNRPAQPEPGERPAREGRPENADNAAPLVPAIVTKVEVPNLWIKLPGRDEPIQVSADDKTVITLDGKAATFAELKVGQHIRIQHPSGTAARIEIQAAEPQK